MAPSNAAPASSQYANGRKATERIVPAIPLALTKPKSAKPKPKVDAETKAGAENPPVEVTNGVHVPQEQASPIANAHGDHHDEATASQLITEAVPDAVTMPPLDTPGSRGSAAMSLSFGGTPELPATDSSHPATPEPVQMQSPISTTSPLSARKPTDTFNMRPLRTELPPDFVPSAGQHTPKSATSPTFNRAQNTRPHARPSHPSTHSIVFGGQDSAASSPAPPQSAGSAFASPTYQAFHSSHQPYYVPQGHAHHVSDAYYRAPHFGYTQSAMGWQARQGYAQPIPQNLIYQQQGHMQYRFPARDGYNPATSQYVNGRTSPSRSASQNSSTAPEWQRAAKNDQSPLTPQTPADNVNVMPPLEPRASSHAYSQSRQSQFHPQMPPPPNFQHPDVAAGFINAEALRDHVLLSFGNPVYSDCQLIITNEHENSELRLDAHRLILHRSRTLLELILKSASAMNGVPAGPYLCAVHLKGRYLRTSAFLDAIRYLYGGSLLQVDQHRSTGTNAEHGPSIIKKMETALQTIAVGTYLRVTSIASRGLDVATGLLNWETVATALAFALDGGLTPAWNVDDSSEDRASTSSSDDSLSRAEPANSPTYEPYSTYVLNRTLDFIVHSFPISFYLDAAAPQLPSCPRLPPSRPTTSASASVSTSTSNDDNTNTNDPNSRRSSRSDPRLSQIRFGDIPMPDHQRPHFVTTAASSVLLSLPFPLLKFVLEHGDLIGRLGPETVASVMRQVVAEREVRRVKALGAGGGGVAPPPIHAHGLANGAIAGRSATDVRQLQHRSLAQNLLWQESVEISTQPQHRAGCRIVRRKREIDTPPSSGACSERNK